MIEGKHHVIITEYKYPREELEKLFFDELNEYVVQYGQKMRWPKTRKQAWTPGLTVVDPTEAGKEWLQDWPLLKQITDTFNIKDWHPNDIDILVYEEGYEFPPHTDYKHHAVIMMPISPREGAEPLTFYEIPGLELEKYTKFRDLDKEAYFDYTLNYSMEYPTLFNGNTIHGVNAVPPGQRRVFLRMKILNEKYEDVLEKLKNGTLLK